MSFADDLDDWLIENPGRTVAFTLVSEGCVACSIDGGVSAMGCDAGDSFYSAFEAERES